MNYKLYDVFKIIHIILVISMALNISQLFNTIWNEDSIEKAFIDNPIPKKMLIPYNIFYQDKAFIDEFFKHSPESCEFDQYEYDYIYFNYETVEHFLVNYRDIIINNLNILANNNNYNLIHYIIVKATYDENIFIIETLYNQVSNAKNFIEDTIILCAPTCMPVIDFIIEHFPEKITASNAYILIENYDYNKSIIQKFTLLGIYNNISIDQESKIEIELAKRIIISLIFAHYDYNLEEYYEQISMLEQYFNEDTFFDEQTIGYISVYDRDELEFVQNDSLSIKMNIIIKYLIEITNIAYVKMNEEDTKFFICSKKKLLKKYKLNTREGLLKAIKINYKFYNVLPYKVKKQYKNDYEVMYTLFKSNSNSTNFVPKGIPKKMLTQILIDFIKENKTF